MPVLPSDSSLNFLLKYVYFVMRLVTIAPYVVEISSIGSNFCSYLVPQKGNKRGSNINMNSAQINLKNCTLSDESPLNFHLDDVFFIIFYVKLGLPDKSSSLAAMFHICVQYLVNFFPN